MMLIYLLCSKTPKCIYPLYYDRSKSNNAKTKLYDNVMKERFRKDASQCKLIHCPFTYVLENKLISFMGTWTTYSIQIREGVRRKIQTTQVSTTIMVEICEP